jgi:hypothetical protein
MSLERVAFVKSGDLVFGNARLSWALVRICLVRIAG